MKIVEPISPYTPFSSSKKQQKYNPKKNKSKLPKEADDLLVPTWGVGDLINFEKETGVDFYEARCPSYETDLYV